MGAGTALSLALEMYFPVPLALPRSPILLAVALAPLLYAAYALLNVPDVPRYAFWVCVLYVLTTSVSALALVLSARGLQWLIHAAVLAPGVLWSASAAAAIAQYGLPHETLSLNVLAFVPGSLVLMLSIGSVLCVRRYFRRAGSEPPRR